MQERNMQDLYGQDGGTIAGNSKERRPFREYMEHSKYRNYCCGGAIVCALGVMLLSMGIAAAVYSGVHCDDTLDHNTTNSTNTTNTTVASARSHNIAGYCVLGPLFSLLCIAVGLGVGKLGANTIKERNDPIDTSDITKEKLLQYLEERAREKCESGSNSSLANDGAVADSVLPAAAAPEERHQGDKDGVQVVPSCPLLLELADIFQGGKSTRVLRELLSETLLLIFEKYPSNDDNNKRIQQQMYKEFVGNRPLGDSLGQVFPPETADQLLCQKVVGMMTQLQGGTGTIRGGFAHRRVAEERNNHGNLVPYV